MPEVKTQIEVQGQTDAVVSAQKEIATQTVEQAPVLFNQYVFNKVIEDIEQNLKTNKIRCNICLDVFEPRKKLYVCRKCTKIFHSECAKECKAACPACRYSRDPWYTICIPGHDIYTILNGLLTIKENIKSLTRFNDLPLNMVPTLEAEYKGITGKINDTFELLQNDKSIAKALKLNMELANFLMLKCSEIDIVHKNIMKQEDDIINRQKTIIQHQMELERQLQEVNRQSEILDGCKRALQASVDQIEKNVNVEIKQLKDTGNVKQRVNQWNESDNQIQTGTTLEEVN